MYPMFGLSCSLANEIRTEQFHLHMKYEPSIDENECRQSMNATNK